VFGRPGEQRGTEVEANTRVVVDYAGDSLLIIQDARREIRQIAFGSYTFVPVVIGVRGVLQLYLFKPGIFTGGLIEVAMNAEIVHRGTSIETIDLCALDV
jgi:hypothetical protein